MALREDGDYFSFDHMDDLIERLPFSGCWIWLGAINSEGYGTTRVHGKSVKAHRLFYQEAHGIELTSDILLMHSCDIRCCVNPHHLQMGSARDNMVDMAKKGRSPIAKLTATDVTLVRERLANGESLRSIAKYFAVTKRVISLIKSGKRYGYF